MLQKPISRTLIWTQETVSSFKTGELKRPVLFWFIFPSIWGLLSEVRLPGHICEACLVVASHAVPGADSSNSGSEDGVLERR